MKNYYLNIINNRNKHSISIEDLFIYLGIFYIVIFFITNTLIIFSVFNIAYLYIIFIVFILLLIYLLISYTIKIDRADLVALFVIFFFGALSFIYFHHTLYGVRDEGVYANSGIGVVTKGSIYIKDFINFP